METRVVKYCNINFIVEGKYYKGYKGNWEQPEEPAEFNIHHVYLCETDITDIFSDEQITELENLALEL